MTHDSSYPEIPWRMGDEYKTKDQLNFLATEVIKEIGYEKLLKVNVNLEIILTRKSLSSYNSSAINLCETFSEVFPFYAKHPQCRKHCKNILYINEYMVSKYTLDEFKKIIFEHELLHCVVDQQHFKNYRTCKLRNCKASCKNELCKNRAHAGLWHKLVRKRNRQLPQHLKILASDIRLHGAEGILEAAKILFKRHKVIRHKACHDDSSCKKCVLYRNQMWQATNNVIKFLVVRP